MTLQEFDSTVAEIGRRARMIGQVLALVWAESTAHQVELAEAEEEREQEEDRWIRFRPRTPGALIEAPRAGELAATRSPRVALLPISAPRRRRPKKPIRPPVAERLWSVEGRLMTESSLLAMWAAEDEARDDS